MTLEDVLYIPDLTYNLISVRGLNKIGNDVIFRRDGYITLVEDNGVEYDIGCTIGNLYHLDDMIVNDYDMVLVMENNKKIDQSVLWHHHLGHLGQSLTTTLVK